MGGRPADRGKTCLGVDLSAHGEAARSTPRASAAVERARAGIPPSQRSPEDMSTTASEPWTDTTCHSVRLDPSTGTLVYQYGTLVGRSLTPMADGRPALKGIEITTTQQGGDVLAVLAEERRRRELWFISISRAAAIGRFSYAREGATRGWFALSRDGRLFARRVEKQRIEVRDVPGDRTPVMTISGEASRYRTASLGRSCLLLGEYSDPGFRWMATNVLIRWDLGTLTVDGDDPAGKFQQIGGAIAQASRTPPPSLSPRFDRTRFVRFLKHGNLQVLLDRYNHVAVLGRGERLVAVFGMIGREFAAWMPDGTCLGPSRLIGGEPTKDAAAKLAAALREAERGERGEP
jgi:hypothetical protein